MKIIILFFMSFSIEAKYTMIKDMQVTKMSFDDQKKLYIVDFKNYAGKYKAKPRDAACFEYSLNNKVPVKVEFVPMGLGIIDCQKVESK